MIVIMNQNYVRIDHTLVLSILLLKAKRKNLSNYKIPRLSNRNYYYFLEVLLP